MNFLQQGSAWLRGVQRQYVSIDVSYRRGDSSITVPATIGRSTFQTDDGSGFPVDTQTRDYLITPADLALDDVLSEPAVGDLIVETDADGVEHQYKVMAPSGEPAWRWSDAYRGRYRIHTKFTGTVPPAPR